MITRIPAIELSALGKALELSTECLTVYVPQLVPFGGYVTDAVDWWAGQLVDFFGGKVEKVGDIHGGVTNYVKDLVGTPTHPTQDMRRPTAVDFAPNDHFDYVVKIPEWQGIVQVRGKPYANTFEKDMSFKDYIDALEASPVPPNVQELSGLLTEIDNLQDEAATITVILMIVKKLTGVAIPGLGAIATVTDALNLLYLAVQPIPPRLPPVGTAGKRKYIFKNKHGGQTYRARVDELLKLGRLKVNVGDVLQALQTTDNWTGTGIQLGAVIGTLTDAVFAQYTGAEYRFPGPWWDPLNFRTEPCTRSPTLASIHPDTTRVLRYNALMTWSRAARIAPWLGYLPETVLASTLVGMKLSVDILFEWFLDNDWVPLVNRAMDIQGRVPGGSDALGTRNLHHDDYVHVTAPMTTGALRAAIQNVPDQGRQAFYDSLVVELGYKIIGMLDPEARIVDSGPSALTADPALLLHHGLIPLPPDLAD